MRICSGRSSLPWWPRRWCSTCWQLGSTRTWQSGAHSVHLKVHIVFSVSIKINWPKQSEPRKRMKLWLTSSCGDIGIAIGQYIYKIDTFVTVLVVIWCHEYPHHNLRSCQVVSCLPPSCYKTQQRLICKHVPTASRLSHITLIHQSFHHHYLNRDEGIVNQSSPAGQGILYSKHTFTILFLARKKIYNSCFFMSS